MPPNLPQSSQLWALQHILLRPEHCTYCCARQHSATAAWCFQDTSQLYPADTDPSLVCAAPAHHCHPTLPLTLCGDQHDPYQATMPRSTEPQDNTQGATRDSCTSRGAGELLLQACLEHAQEGKHGKELQVVTNTSRRLQQIECGPQTPLQHASACTPCPTNQAWCQPGGRTHRETGEQQEEQASHSSAARRLQACKTLRPKTPLQDPVTKSPLTKTLPATHPGACMLHQGGWQVTWQIHAPGSVGRSWWHHH